MMIMGGGIVSWLQGVVADETTIHELYCWSNFVLLYLAFYAWKVKRNIKKIKVLVLKVKFQ